MGLNANRPPTGQCWEAKAKFDLKSSLGKFIELIIIRHQNQLYRQKALQQ